MDDNPQTTSLLHNFFWTTALVYALYILIKNIRYIVWFIDSLWYGAFRLGHFCVGVFSYDT
jgi:hypothetical protein